MNLPLIRELLEPYEIVFVKGEPAGIREVLMFEPGVPDREGLAYIADDPGAAGRYRYALILSIGETRIDSDREIRLAPCSAKSVMNTLLRVLWRLERLNEALYGASENQELIDIASRLTRLPFFYFDDSYRIIAISRRVYYEMDEEWRHMTEKGYLSPENARRMSENGELEYLAGITEPVIFDSELYPFISVSCNVRYRNVFRGRINMLVVDRDAYQEHIAICSIVHDHLLRLLREGKTADGKIGLRNLLSDILNGRGIRDVSVENILRGAGMAPDGCFQLYAMEIDPGGDPQLFNYYTKVLERLLFDAMICVFSFEDRLIVLTCAEDPEKCVPIRVKIGSFLAEQHLKCGVSHTFRDLSQARGFYEQALWALNSGGTKPMVPYDDVLLERMISFIPERQRAYMLCGGFESLLAADKESSFPMAETLFAYLENGCNLIRAADALAIHKNTMLYRLNRIREQIDIDLEDHDTRVALEFSFLLWKHGL